MFPENVLRNVSFRFFTIAAALTPLRALPRTLPCPLKSRIIWKRNKHVCIFTYLGILRHAILRDLAINISNLESLINDCVTLGHPCDRCIKIIIPVLLFTRDQYIKTWDLAFCFLLFIPNMYTLIETLQMESGENRFGVSYMNFGSTISIYVYWRRNSFALINWVICLATYLLRYCKLIYKFNILNEKWFFV